VLATCIRGYRTLLRAFGSERKIRACVTASIVGMSACISNVWFTPEFAGLFFALVALVWNQSSPDWYVSLPGGRAMARARRSGAARVTPAAVPSHVSAWQRPPVSGR
jgi:hypothetical protein